MEINGACEPLIYLLKLQYHHDSSEKLKEFENVNFEEKTEELLQTSTTPEQTTSVNPRPPTNEFLIKQQKVRSLYENLLIKDSRNIEANLCMGIYNQFSLRNLKIALNFYDIVHNLNPTFKFNSMLLYACKKLLSVKTTEIYQDILGWKLLKNCQLVELAELFFKPICYSTCDSGFILGIAYHVAKEYDLARKYFQISVLIDHSYCLGWRYLAGILRDYFKLFEKTLRIYDKVLTDIDPNCVQVYYNKGFMLKNQFESFEEAQECFEKCIELDPTHISAHNRLADLYLNTNLPKKAEELNIQALVIDPNHFRSTVDLGHLYRKELNEREKARHFYERAIRLRPNEHRVFASLGKLLRKSYFDYEGAREQYTRALELAPKSSRTHLELGNLLSKHFKDWEEARKHYMMSMKVRGDYEKPYKSLKKGEEQLVADSELISFIEATSSGEAFEKEFESLTPDSIAVKLFDYPDCFRCRAEIKFRPTYDKIFMRIMERQITLFSELRHLPFSKDIVQLVIRFILGKSNLLRTTARSNP